MCSWKCNRPEFSFDIRENGRLFSIVVFENLSEIITVLRCTFQVSHTHNYLVNIKACALSLSIPKSPLNISLLVLEETGLPIPGPGVCQTLPLNLPMAISNVDDFESSGAEYKTRVLQVLPHLARSLAQRAGRK